MVVIGLETSPAAQVNGRLDFTGVNRGNLFAAAGGTGFLDGVFNHFPGFAGKLLNPAHQLFLFAFGVAEIIVRELGPFLFELALGDVPVAFDFECRHDFVFWLVVSICLRPEGKSIATHGFKI
jgi:hypothetical protein